MSQTLEVGKLSTETVEALRESRMDSRHESLNALMPSPLEQAQLDAAEKRIAYRNIYQDCLKAKRVADDASKLFAAMLDEKLNNRILGQ